MQRIVNLVLVCAICAAGYWWWSKMQRENTRQIRETCEEEERVRGEMKNYAEKVRLDCEERCEAAKRDFDGLRSDVERMEEVVSGIMSLKDADGSDLKYESKVLRILRSDEIGKIALKHIGKGLQGLSEEFVARVRETSDAEKRYADAIKEVQDMHADVSKSARNWARMASEQREGEIMRKRSVLSK